MLSFLHVEISIPKWFHTLWHTVSIIRERRQLLQVQDLPHVDIDADMVELLYKTRNNAIRLVSLHMEVTFNLHDAINCLYDSLYAIDVGIANFQLHFPLFRIGSCPILEGQNSYKLQCNPLYSCSYTYYQFLLEV